MAQKTPGTVTKIYSLKTIGVPDVVKDIETVTKKLNEAKKALQELRGQKSNTNEDAEIKKLNDQIKEQVKLERELTLQIKQKAAEKKKEQLIDQAAKQKQFSTGVNDNSIAKARVDNKALRAERDLLNTSTAEGTKRINELNEAINRNNDLIETNSDKLTKRKINVGNYEGSAKIIVDALERTRQKVVAVEKEFGKMSPEAAQVRGEFQALERITGQPQFLNMAAKFGEASSEIKFFTKALTDLQRQGQGNSQAAIELKNHLAELTDQVGDTKQEIKALSSDTRGFDLFAGAVNLAADTFQAAAGAAVLFGASEKDAQEATATLMAVMSVSNGIKGIAKELTDKGTFANKIYAFSQLQIKTAFDATASAGARFRAVMTTIGIGALIVGIGLLIANFSKLRDAFSGVSKSQREINDATEKGIENASTEIFKLQETYRRSQNLNLSLKDRKKAVKELHDQYPKTFGNLTTEAILAGEAASQYQLLVDSLYAKYKAEALGDILKEKTKKHTLEQIELQNKILDNNKKIRDMDAKGIVKKGYVTPDALFKANDRFRVNLQENEVLFKRENGLLFQQKDLEEKKGKLAQENADLKERLDKLAKGNHDAIKDRFAEIDTIRDRDLANEKIRLGEIKKIRETTAQEEIDHVKKIESINDTAITSKIKTFQAIKKLDVEHLKNQAELENDQIDLALKTAEEIQKIKDDQFAKEEKLLSKRLDRAKKNIELQVQDVSNNPNATEEQRVQARLNADRDIKTLQVQFNANMDALEKKFNQQSIDNAEERKNAIEEILRSINDDTKKLALAKNVDNQAKFDKVLQQMQIDFSTQRKAILDNDKLTVEEKEKALEKLAKAHNITILSFELQKLNSDVEDKKKLLDAGLIAEKDYLEAVAAARAKAEQVSAAAGGPKKKDPFTIKGFIKKVFNLPDDADLDQLLGQVLTEAYTLAQDAMHSFFDAEAQRIRDNLDLQQQRLDLEKEQVIARAQSSAEVASLDKQYADKKKKLDQEAGEQLKKNKRAEAKIALATELANIAVAAAGNPANAVTFGAAGIIMYAILSALAVGRYALNVAAINREKFARGGVPKTGGPIKGKSHAAGGVPFSYEAEDGELAIINKKSARDNRVRTITGTNMQIASLINELGGGISFARGAAHTKFASGGFIGESLQPPVFVPSNNTFTNSSNKDILAAIKEQSQMLREQTEETKASIYRIKTYVVERDITTTQKRQAIKTAVGTMG